MKSQLLELRLRDSPLLLAAGLVSFAALPAHAQVVGDPLVVGGKVKFRVGVLSSICTITATEGELGTATNGTAISSSAADLPAGAFSGIPTSATVGVTSNMNDTATLVAATPTLAGPTAAATSELRLGALAYAPTSTQNLAPNGSLNTTLDVKFGAPAGGFADGVYSATAIVTCNK